MEPLIRAFVLTIAIALPAWAESADLPKTCPAPQPSFKVSDKDAGTVVLTITFDQKGRVSLCDVAKSSASSRLTAYTANFVKKNWSARSLADQQVSVPFKYESSPNYASELSPPPYPTIAYWTHQVGDVVVLATFDQSGTLEKCVVEKTTTAPALVKYTTESIEGNWGGKDLAGKAVEATITYGPNGTLGVTDVHNILIRSSP